MDDAAPTNRPLVSIIIPVYNVEDYVRHTLDSVLNQGLGLGQIEVIAVDDGSTDDSGRILDAYAAQYDYFVVRHQERSEEHTSELQSRGHLVCRLLLEKKNNTKSSRARCHST